MSDRNAESRSFCALVRIFEISGAGLIGAAFLGAAGCGGGESSRTIIYAEGPDDTSTLSKLLDGFNEEQAGEAQAEYREMPADTQGYFDQLRTGLQAGSSGIDVIAGDVIWPAQLAANGYVLDLSDRFTRELQNEFLPGNVESNIYEDGIYGVPFVTGAGFLYYRGDLLEASGFSEPPETWEELKEMAKKAQRDAGTEFGFVFQGGDYEGGIVNCMEYVWTHGGEKGFRPCATRTTTRGGATTESSPAALEDEWGGGFTRHVRRLTRRY